MSVSLRIGPAYTVAFSNMSKKHNPVFGERNDAIYFLHACSVLAQSLALFVFPSLSIKSFEAQGLFMTQRSTVNKVNWMSLFYPSLSISCHWRHDFLICYHCPQLHFLLRSCCHWNAFIKWTGGQL